MIARCPSFGVFFSPATMKFTAQEVEGEAGVGGADVPCGEEDDAQLDVVGRREEDDVTGAEAATPQRRRRPIDAGQQLGVRQRPVRRHVPLRRRQNNLSKSAT